MRRGDTPWARAVADPTRPLDERVTAARSLAVLSTDDAIAVLATILASGTSALRAAVAEALGLATHPRALELLTTLLREPDVDVAAASVRALAWRRGEEAMAELDLVLTGAGNARIRCEAARALAAVAGPESAAAFAQSLVRTADDDVWDAALTALASRPLRDTRTVFEALLSVADSARRATILDALGDAPGDAALVAAPWLRDTSAAVREAAALAMAASQRAGDAGPLVVEALGRERDARVRAALHQALANQLGFDAEP